MHALHTYKLEPLLRHGFSYLLLRHNSNLLGYIYPRVSLTLDFPFLVWLSCSVMWTCFPFCLHYSHFITFIPFPKMSRNNAIFGRQRYPFGLYGKSTILHKVKIKKWLIPGSKAVCIERRNNIHQKLPVCVKRRMLVNRPEIVPVSLAWLIDSEWESQVPEVGTYTRETKERR